MLRDNISYKCQLRKLQNKKELTSDGYSKQIKEARKSGADRDELDSLAHEAHMPLICILIITFVHFSLATY